MAARTKAARKRAPASIEPPRQEIVVQSLREQIVSVLQRAIIMGTYKPGQRLVERELTAQFGVSTIPVREALQELEIRGLVTKRHNYGCSVVELTAEDVDSICNLRRVLEPRVIEWAAGRITREHRSRLRAQLDRLARAAAKDDLPEFFHEDLVLHKMVWEIAGNKYAARALESAVGSLFAAGLSGGRSAGILDLRQEVKKHKRMVELLSSGEGAGAAQTLLDIAGGFESCLQPADTLRAGA